MAATPTELLAVDTRRLEESNQRVASRMDGLEKEFVAFRSRMNVLVSILSAGILLVFGSAGMIWTGVSSLQRELGRTEATIGNFDKRFGRVAKFRRKTQPCHRRACPAPRAARSGRGVSKGVQIAAARSTPKRGCLKVLALPLGLPLSEAKILVVVAVQPIAT